MPTPIGHALAGLAIAGLASRQGALTTRQIGVLVAFAIAPDLDLLGKFIDGVNHHRGATHSVVAAGFAGLAGLLASRAGWKAPSALAMSGAWFSHVLLDFLGVDTTPPFGEMVLWPFSQDFYISPVALFYDVGRSMTLETVRHNLVALALEAAVLVPTVALCWRRRPGPTAP